MFKLNISTFLCLILALISTNIIGQIQLGTDIDGTLEDENFGSAIAFSNAGTRVAIGAMKHSSIAENQGQVRIYEWDGSNWEQMGSVIDGLAEGDFAGGQVAISATGNRVAISAFSSDANGNNSGQVMVYEWDGIDWAQLGSNINGLTDGDRFGWSLAMADNGNRIAVGAPFSSAGNYEAGQTRMFRYNGSNWVQLGAPINGENISDESGESVAFGDNGNRVAIGAMFNADNGYNSGHVRVFEWDVNQWVQIGADIDGDMQYDRSGRSVSLSQDGNHLAIGAHAHNADNYATTGQVRVFEFDGNNWMQNGSDLEGEAGGDRFGWSCSLSNDGSRLAVGAPQNDGGGSFSGHARVFDFDGSEWVQILMDINGEAPSDGFGRAVSISGTGTRLAVAANLNDANGEDSGHVRVYDLLSCNGIVDATVAQSSNEFMANQDDATYQWFDCSQFNILPIEGATQQTFIAPQEGSFAVRVSYEGCTELSDCLDFNCIGLIDSTITLDGNQFTAIQEGATYQWLNCDSMTIIEGATFQTFTASVDGNYAVQIFLDGCTQLSNCLNYSCSENIDPTISLNGITLTASQAGATYQWTNCDSGEILSGETNQSFEISLSGNYGVIITLDDCSILSECLFITLYAISETFPTKITSFPNPLKDKVQIDMGDVYQEIKVELFDEKGSRLFQDEILNQKTFHLDLQNFPAGNYFLQLHTSDYQSIINLVKH